MKILLLGKDGQVGWELQRALSPLGELIALNRHGNADWCGSLTDFENLRKTVTLIKPDVIVNAAAYTAVDKAEADRALAQAVNTIAPGVLAEAANAIGALFVHYSTDYVFNGRGTAPWTESDTPDPINYYGQTKFEGEELIRASGCNFLIFRISWVYGLQGHNFVKTMLRLMHERKTLSVINDQIGSPISAELVADVTSLVLAATKNITNLREVYHLAPSGAISWYDFAHYILNNGIEKRSRREIVISPVPSSDYPTPAARPHNSRLDTRKLVTDFSICMPSWELGVHRVLVNLLR